MSSFLLAISIFHLLTNLILAFKERWMQEALNDALQNPDAATDAALMLEESCDPAGHKFSAENYVV